MMGGMMVLGWIGGLLLVAVLIGVVVMLVRDARPAANVALAVLAVIGGITLVGVAAMALMHGGMMGCCS